MFKPPIPDVTMRELDYTNPAGLQKDESNIQASGDYIGIIEATVTEVITDPINWLNQPAGINPEELIKKNADFLIFADENSIEVSPKAVNYWVANHMPFNAIMFMYSTTGGDNSTQTTPHIAFPFFSSHFSLPIKAGERVWLVKKSAGGVDSFYWMARPSAGRYVEDVNYTYAERESFINEGISKKNRDYAGVPLVLEKDTVPLSSFSNSPESSLPPGVNNSKICASSFEYLKSFTGEPVPPIIGDGCDVILQGSNNTLIHMAKEKFMSIDEHDQKVFTNPLNTSQSNIRKPLAGCIDIVVGRKKERLKTLAVSPDPSALNLPKELNAVLGKRPSGNNTMEYYERDKTADLTIMGEDKKVAVNSPTDVFSRMYLSMNATPDKDFGVLTDGLHGLVLKRPTVGNLQTSLLLGDEIQVAAGTADFVHQKGPSAVTYSDLVRSYANENIRLVNLCGNSIIEMDNVGNITLQAGQGPTAAKLILRATGDIIIKPGATGVVKLGGDDDETGWAAACGVDTTLAPVPSPAVAPNIAQSTTSVPDPLGITTTMGGTAFSLGNPPGQDLSIPTTITPGAQGGGPVPAIVGTAIPAVNDGSTSPKVIIKT